MLGTGTDGIGRELKKRLTNAKKIILLDDEKPENKKLNISAQNNIFIGTSGALQYISDLGIKTAVMADPDLVLSLPEYKSAEELWQKIRLVQTNLPADGLFYIQTRLPDHHVFQGVYNPDVFYAKEISDRKAFDYPPAKFLLRLYYGGSTQEEANNEAERLFKALNGLTQGDVDAIISSPLPSNPPYYRQRYWRVILIKIGYSAYKKTIRSLLSVVPEAWKVDPNPNNTLSVT
jgi:primosomal protein N'